MTGDVEEFNFSRLACACAIFKRDNFNNAETAGYA